MPLACRIDDSFDKLLLNINTTAGGKNSAARESIDKSTATSGKKPVPMTKPKGLLPKVTSADSGISAKPAVPPKPKTKPSPSTNNRSFTKQQHNTDLSSPTLDLNDVMKYIEQNSQNNDVEPDLFA